MKPSVSVLMDENDPFVLSSAKHVSKDARVVRVLRYGPSGLLSTNGLDAR